MALYLDFPHIDELLVSVLGRFIDGFHVLSRNEFIKGLFGYLPTFSTYYMSNLDALASETAQCWGWTYEKIAQELTIFPYLKAYLSQADADKLLAACRTIVIKSTIGRELTNFVRIPTRILVCPECFREDRVEHRPQYWRRAHQLPAVIFCWRHKIKLRMVTVGSHERIWHTPGSLQGLDRDIPVELSAEQRQRCIAVAELSNELLSGSQKLARDRLPDYWIRVLQGTGFARGIHLFSDKHAHALRAFFGDSYLQFVGCPAEPKFNHSRLIKHSTIPGTSALEFFLWNAFISDLGSQLNWVTWPLCPGAVRTPKADGLGYSEFERLATPSRCTCGRCVTFAENPAARWPSAYTQPAVRGVTRPLHEREHRRRQYTDSIKEKARKCCRQPGATVSGVARELGVGYDALRIWVQGSRRRRKHSCFRGMLTSGEAAAILKVSIKQFNRLAESGALGAILRTRGGHRRFSREGILARRKLSRWNNSLWLLNAQWDGFHFDAGTL